MPWPDGGDARAQLDAWLAHCERLHPSTIDMTLERVAMVRDRLGLRFHVPVVSVAGTNGKGSCCAMLESVALQSGWRVGLYIKPHLVRFEERCRVNGSDVPAETLLPQFAADPKAPFEALISVAQNLQTRHGDWRVPWGELFRVQRRPQMIDLFGLPFDDRLPSLPCVAGPGPLGIVFTQYYSPSIRIPFVVSLNQRYGLVGASYMAVYEFGDKIRGASLLNAGVSGDPDSPHFFDQAELLSKCKLKPELFDWPDVLAGAKLVYRPGEPPVDRVAK